MKAPGAAAVLCLVLGGCALKGDVRRVESALTAQRAEAARADSARAADLAQLLVMQRRILDTLSAQYQRLVRLETFQGDVRTELTALQGNLAQVRELISATQQRLSGLQGGAPRGATTGGAAPPGTPEADQLFRASQGLLSRGSRSSARDGFQKFLADYPTHPNVPHAMLLIGESWDSEQPDSVVAAYDRLIKAHPTSLRSGTALYRLGLIAERAGRADAARAFYQRVVTEFPNSDEARTAREKLAGR